MKHAGKLEFIYFVNTSLLFSHEVDSAYWNEWILFGLPGGIQLFLVMNIILVVIGLVGFRYVVLRKRSSLWFSLLQSICGMFAFIIHGIYIMKGYKEFTLPVSEILLILILLVSVIQCFLSVYGLVVNNKIES
jgi:hypothetical protein